MFNNSKPPFDNPEMRRALALCTDRDEYIAFRAPGHQLANGPFAEGSLGYIADPGFPQFDPEAGNALLDEIGRPDEIVYGTTNVPSNLLTAELFADQWSTNCGLTVNIDQFDQSELITKAITGDFEVFLWRNHGQSNPGLEFIWWHSRHAEGLALNFGRIKDPNLDAAARPDVADDRRRHARRPRPADQHDLRRERLQPLAQHDRVVHPVPGRRARDQRDDTAVGQRRRPVDRRSDLAARGLEGRLTRCSGCAGAARRGPPA